MFEQAFGESTGSLARIGGNYQRRLKPLITNIKYNRIAAMHLSLSEMYLGISSTSRVQAICAVDSLIADRGNLVFQTREAFCLTFLSDVIIMKLLLA
jgi:hypothetical protein